MKKLYRKGLGFTLVEIIIAMFLGSALLIVSSQVLIQAGKTNRLAHQKNIIQETATVAKYFIERDVHRTGYYGGLTEEDIISGTEKVKSFTKQCERGDENFAMMLFPKIFSLNNTRTGYSCLENYVVNSDVLVLRYLLPVKQVENAKSKRHKLYMQVNASEGKLFKAMNKNHYSNKFSDKPGDLFEVKSYIYYLRDTGRKCHGDAIKGLYREYNNNKGYMEAEEIITGIEQMQLRFLLNDQLLNADEVSNEEWRDVRAVSFSLLLRADCSESFPYKDTPFYLQDFVYQPETNKAFIRQIYNFEIALRN